MLSGREGGAESVEEQPGQLSWERVAVDGRPAVYGVAGEGPVLVFLHGWGLAHRTYRRALAHVVGHGLRVYAPGLPGFAGTAELPASEFSLAGYSRWVDRFLTAANITTPVILVGHSFGGGVAIRTAYDFPERVSRLVLVNSIGGSAWTDGARRRTLRERPLWDWGLHLQADTLSMRQLTRVLPVIAADAVPNVLRQPRTVWRAGHLARTADLTEELAELKHRRLPVVILWGRNDTVLPLACLESLRIALGEPVVHTVDGNHAWILARPERFAEHLTTMLATELAAGHG
jgi:pimeloyl-ACP methyl ester carboxylesterase